MESLFANLRQIRKNILSFIELINNETLNKKINGFNNSIIWNVAHVIATQQVLCYKLSGLDYFVSEQFIDKFKKGTGYSIVTDDEILLIKSLLLNTIDVLEKDYNDGKFKNFELYMTSFGIELSSIEDAIIFNNVHEGLHFGYILAQKRAISNF